MTEKEKNKIINELCGNNMKGLRKICMPLIQSKNVATMEYDDLLSDAQMVLLECIDRYNPKLNDNFIGYLVSNIRKSYIDWTRDHLREKRCNYARGKNWQILKDENGNKIIQKGIPLDADTNEARNICEKVPCDINIEASYIKKVSKEKFSRNVTRFLDTLTPLQRKIAILIADDNSKEEICSILHITEKHYDHSLKKIITNNNTPMLHK